MNKKTMLAISALCATVAFQAKAIESDVVGYNTTTLDESGWMINIGVAFSNVASQDGSFVLNDNFFSGTAAEGDQVITFDAAQWNLSTYDKLAGGEGWLFTAADGVTQELLEAVVVNKGDMIYYFPTGASEVSIAGKVANPGEAQSVMFDLDNEAGQWVFPLVNPFPVDTTWGELNTFTLEGDQLIAFDAAEWNLATYDCLADGEGWLFTAADGVTQEILNDKEVVAIPAGTAMYYAPVQTTTWTVEL